MKIQKAAIIKIPFRLFKKSWMGLSGRIYKAKSPAAVCLLMQTAAGDFYVKVFHVF